MMAHRHRERKEKHRLILASKPLPGVWRHIIRVVFMTKSARYHIKSYFLRYRCAHLGYWIRNDFLGHYFYSPPLGTSKLGTWVEVCITAMK